jgi:hypothetical protein
VERSWGIPGPAECFGINLPWVEGGSMENLIASRNVIAVVYEAVAFGAVKGVVAERRNVGEAVSRREDPPHPGLGLYLEGVA